MAYKKSRKKEEETEDWLMTYADAITLLLCFFVIILNVAEPSQSSFEKLRAGFMSEFAEETVSTPFSDIYDAFMATIHVGQLNHDVSVEETEKGIVLEFNSASIFAPGSADILPRAKPMLDEITLELVRFEYDDFMIEVEGHTDDAPINTPQFPSNWELSTNRASSVVRFFIDKGLDPTRLKAAGYADIFPKMPNRDSYGEPIEENRAVNRRVIVRLERP